MCYSILCQQKLPLSGHRVIWVGDVFLCSLMLVCACDVACMLFSVVFGIHGSSNASVMVSR